jgi:hypothetical protein
MVPPTLKRRGETHSMVTPSSPVIVFLIIVSLVVVLPFILFVFLVVWLFSNEGFHKLLR